MGGDMRYLIPLFFVLFSSVSLADDYYWIATYTGQGFVNNHEGRYPSPNALCTSKLSAGWVLGDIVIHAPNPSGVINGSCKSIYNGAVMGDMSIRRGGGSCPDGTEYNSQTGECAGPEPEPECEQNWTGGDMVYSPSLQQCVKYPNLPPPEFCQFMAGKDSPRKRQVTHGDASGPTSVSETGSFCVLQVTDAKCVVGVDGLYDCAVTGKYTGDHDDTALDAPGHCTTMDCEHVPPADPEPRPETITDSKPCVYSSSGDKQTCTSSSSEEKQGTADCGIVNGVPTCITKQPTKNGIDISTEIKTDPTPDGGSKTTKTDTATVTKCDGIGKCVTTTTTTKTTTTKDGSGNTTGSTTECQGAACKSGSGGVKGGTGEGTGICANGDCSNEGFNDPAGEGGLDDAPGYGDSLNDFMQRLGASPLATAVTDIALPGGGSCSMPGQQIYMLGTISAQSMCDLADVLDGLRFVFLAFFGFAAVRVLMSA